LKQPAVGASIIVAFAVALLVKTFAIDIMIADGDSMSPAIKAGTVLLVCKAFYGIRASGEYLFWWGKPHSGDIVIFYTPEGNVAVKRYRETAIGNLFYAEGDNLVQSYDSRNYGPVPKDNIIGRVLGVK